MCCTCPTCGSVFATKPVIVGEEIQAACSGCGAVYGVTLKVIRPPREKRRLVAPEQRVRVSQG